MELTTSTPTYEKGQLYQISIVDFQPDPNQPRKSMDPQALAELADSIKSVGVLQPLLFRVGIGGHDGGIGGHDVRALHNSDFLHAHLSDQENK